MCLVMLMPLLVSSGVLGSSFFEGTNENLIIQNSSDNKIMLDVICPVASEHNYEKNDKTVDAPDDPWYPSQWSLENTGQSGGIVDVDIDAFDAWQICTGSEDVVIAIIDSGIDFNHPDLMQNIWINEDEVAGNDIDDDNNGYVDDVNGYDFTLTDGDSIPFDRNGHGTLLAGRCVPVTNNGEGLAGITWNCKLMPLQVIDDLSWQADMNHIIEAVRYAKENGADIICMTFESSSFNQEFQDAINDAFDEGVFICAAAGNAGVSAKRYPAGYENVVAVGAINQWNDRMEYTYEGSGISIASNFGSWVDIASPGQEIISTMPTYHTPLNEVYDLDENYTVATGCCVTTPLVAGVAALLKSNEPTLSPEEIAFILRASTEPVDSEYYLGTGRLNAFNALTYNNKPTTPNGPSSGKINVEHTYSSSIPYAEGEMLYYCWDFGDGEISDWMGPIESGQQFQAAHTYTTKGDYSVKVRVKDESGAMSDWSDPLPISMPKQRSFENFTILNLLNELFDFVFKGLNCNWSTFF